jgi:D-3-phosphoglycerate dehydrogenase
MIILFIDTANPVLEQLLLEDGHKCIDGSKLSRSEILNSVSGYEGIIIRSRIEIDKEIIDAARNLKFIARVGSGMESIHVSYAESKGIACINSPEGSRDAVGEHAVAMLLALFNKLIKADKEIRHGDWIREGNRGTEINGKTIGIIGYGQMGSSFAKKISGFDCEVLAYDKYLKNFSNHFVKEVSMNEIFMRTDILSLHVPLNQETTYLVDDAFISRFKKNIYIINVARGRCIKTDDLVKNMKSGKVPGACLDVIEYEDRSFEKFTLRTSEVMEDPSWQYLIQSDNVVFSPHIAGWTFESNEKMASIIFEKIKKVTK